MKNIKSITILLVSLSLLFMINLSTNAQENRIPKSPRAFVKQQIGTDTEISFDYSRPGVKGRKIWGELVPYGMYPGNQYSKDKPYPWRAGADKNTTIEFNNDIFIEGNKIPAGQIPHVDQPATDLKRILNGTGKYQAAFFQIKNCLTRLSSQAQTTCMFFRINKF